MRPRPRSANKRRAAPGGFTLLETVVAISVLAIGLLSAALLMSITYKYSVRSRYMAEAAQLASEKLEDLGRYPAQISSVGVVNPDAHVFVPSGATCQITATTTGANCVGSIAPALTCPSPGNCTFNPAAVAQSITLGDAGAGGTVSGSTATASYSDAVYLSSTTGPTGGGYGTLQETYQTVAGSSPTYVTLTFSPNGQVPVPSKSNSPPSAGGETFDRRWVIEQDQPVPGVRRITVLVTLMDQTVQPPVTYQMSMVRP